MVWAQVFYFLYVCVLVLLLIHSLSDFDEWTGWRKHKTSVKKQTQSEVRSHGSQEGGIVALGTVSAQASTGMPEY
jgi:hypothetical protein